MQIPYMAHIGPTCILYHYDTFCDQELKDGSEKQITY